MTKIQTLLKEQGLTMGEVVIILPYLAGDPAEVGKRDFVALMAATIKFSGTASQPKKPARHAMRVAALVDP